MIQKKRQKMAYSNSQGKNMNSFGHINTKHQEWSIGSPIAIFKRTNFDV